MAEHNYLIKIYAMWACGELPREAGLHNIAVSHDGWCGIYQHRLCDCQPDITLTSTLYPGMEN